MPEDDLSQTALPVSPAETTETATPPANDQSAKTVSVPENSLAQKIRQAGATVFNAAGIPFRRGRGRPRKDGQPNALAVPLGEPGAASPVPMDIPPNVASPVPSPALPAGGGGVADALPAFDAEINSLFRKCVAGGAKGITEGCNAVTRSLAHRAGIDSAFTEKTLENAKPDADALENFSASVDLVLAKHAPQIKEGGEWYCLGLSAGRILAPYALVWWEFKKEIERKRNATNLP